MTLLGNKEKGQKAKSPPRGVFATKDGRASFGSRFEATDYNDKEATGTGA